MTDQLFDPDVIATADAEALPGSRLHRLEVYNWGTFDQKVWTFDIGGRNALLTGDIGSGKSTLVDAVTTLLLPANRIAYNKAAGADVRERDLRSYVLGHYKSERNETTGTSRPVGLRDTRHYSVIVGVFTNVGYGDTVTLAQVFRARDVNQGQPDRFYVVAESELSIAKDFSDFGDEIAGLRRKLRDRGARLYDSFPDYGRDFRRQLGIESEQAMELFHQTVSMKAVDNLNDFVRSHMLEPFETRDRIDALVEHFDDLTKAYEAVLRARAQLELLTPLVTDLDAHEGFGSAIDLLERQSRALPFLFAQRTKTLIKAELAMLVATIDELDVKIGEAEGRLRDLRGAEAELGIQIAGCGGDRLAALEEARRRLESEDLPSRRNRLNRFNELLREAGLDEVTVADQFSAVRQRADTRELELKTRVTELDNDLTERKHHRRQIQDDAQAVNDELRSLQARHSNLPRRSLELRDQLCSDLNIDSDEVPFAGELIKVRDDAPDWQGAAERVLRGFALSLLVPDAHYGPVAEWIDDHHLNARVVYFRVPQRRAPAESPERRAAQPLLVDMLEVKPDSDFASWIRSELDRRANHRCIDSVAEFRSVDKAVTRRGQVKDRDRHEKDDRRRIDDQRDYVLGWTNEQKVQALITHATSLHQELAKVGGIITELETGRTGAASTLDRLVALREYSNWEELDWHRVVTRISELRREEELIRSSSDELKAFSDERDRVRSDIAALDRTLGDLQQDRGGASSRHESASGELENVERILRDTPALENASAEFESIEQLMRTELSTEITDRAVARDAQQSVATALANRKESAVTQQNRLAQRIVRSMGAFRNAYPQETLELDDSIESAGEYRDLHERVATDDLPRFEQEFKDYLNQNTIRDIASLSAQLNKQETIIRDRVNTINVSLHGIDYNEGRYIRLVPDRTPNTEIREFREDLRACTDNVVGAESDQYSEDRFLQVKRIVDRFKGREGSVDQDRNWTRRVTDVRQWFVFSASERWREDDREHENYTDSGGKSGGQKEKLAYTILAASLAYQFKLDWEVSRSKAFRFVVIDEAFGRGSDDSTRYALNLFTRLGLQLLIVTPLQKIHVIEPHVTSVGFVDNLNGNYSRLQCLTVEEHRRRRQDRA